MKQVAKIVLIDGENNYLLMRRSNHPTLGEDPDLPGGTVEDGEQPIDGMVREVQEEAGIAVDASKALGLYRGTEYSVHQTEYSLYSATLSSRPEITMSWEHSSYEWLNREDFLKRIEGSRDTYMQMVHDVLRRTQ